MAASTLLPEIFGAFLAAIQRLSLKIPGFLPAAPAKAANLKGINERDLQTLVKLKYALMPPKKEEINNLEDKTIEIFETMDNETLNTLADLMKQNKDNEDVFLQLLQQAFLKVGIDIEDAKDDKTEVTNGEN
jgi:hypothetical protein